MTLAIPHEVAKFERTLQAIAAYKTIYFERGAAIVSLEKGGKPRAQGRTYDVTTWFLVGDLHVDGQSHKGVTMATIMAADVFGGCEVGIGNLHWSVTGYAQEIIAELRRVYKIEQTKTPDPTPAPASSAAGDDQVMTAEQRAPTLENRIKARLVMYLWKDGGKVSGKSFAGKQEAACDAIDMRERTFRHYKKEGLLLSDKEIADMGYTLEELLQLALQNRLRDL